MDPLSATSPDVLGANPVVLAVVEDVAYLVGANGAHVFIIATNFFPLENRQETKSTDDVIAEKNTTSVRIHVLKGSTKAIYGPNGTQTKS